MMEVENEGIRANDELGHLDMKQKKCTARVKSLTDYVITHYYVDQSWAVELPIDAITHSSSFMAHGAGESLCLRHRLDELNTLATVKLSLRLRSTPATLMKRNRQLLTRLELNLEDGIQRLRGLQSQNMEGARHQNKQLVRHCLHNFF